MEKLTHYIDGKMLEGSSGRYGDVFDPATGQVQKQVPLASADELDVAVKAAAAAFPAWAAHAGIAAGTLHVPSQEPD